MNEEILPTLAKPGAGLPYPELVIARLLFKWTRMTGNEAGFRQRFVEERERIRSLLSVSPTARRGERVLIQRVRGLEDSSRHWSIWMTLDHLRIVHDSIAGVLDALGRHQVPPGKASTAAVKPSTSVGPEVEEAYEASCERVLAMLNRTAERRSGVRFAHPWFGPLDAFGWCALAGTHLRIHRLQVERILNQLRCD